MEDKARLVEISIRERDKRLKKNYLICMTVVGVITTVSIGQAYQSKNPWFLLLLGLAVIFVVYFLKEQKKIMDLHSDYLKVIYRKETK